MATLAMVNGRQADVFNSYYGGYIGNTTSSLPPPVIQMPTFWDDQKIEEMVTERHIQTHINDAVLRKKLDEPLTFGEGLTEMSYLEWILEHTKRLYLILAELGCAERIFDLIDGSWDDGDLPLSSESLEKLGWGSGLEKRFAKKQQYFVVRELERGKHIDYADDEIVPLEVIFRPGARLHASVEKVYYPRDRNFYYSRRRVTLGDEPNQLSIESFQKEIRTLKSISHPHIVSLHASYTFQDVGYLVLSPCMETNIKTFIQYPPITFKDLPKEERRRTLLNWLHCLSDALAYLHEEGIIHGSLKPSTIIVTSTQREHTVYIADVGNQRRLDQSTQKTRDIEAYEYGPPEHWIRGVSSHEPLAPSTEKVFTGRRWRRPLEPRQKSNDQLSPTSPEFPVSPTTPTTPDLRGVSLSGWLNPSSIDPSKSDTFSMGCIFLDILTFYSKRKASAFASHRSSGGRGSRSSARGSALPDTSFHANMNQVGSWIQELEKQAGKKNDGAAANSLLLVRNMIAREPAARPGLRAIANRAYRIVLLGMGPTLPHCGIHTVVDPNLALFGGWEVGQSGMSSESGGGVSSRMGSVSTGVTSLGSYGSSASSPTKNFPLVGI